MPRLPRTLDPSLGEVFTVAQAMGSGTTRRRLRAQDLETPHRGVRRRRAGDLPIGDGEPLAIDREARRAMLRHVEAYRPVMPGHAFLVARTAAVAWELPIQPGPNLEVGVFAPRHAVRRAEITGVKVAPGLATVRQLAGLRVTDPATTWAMLAGQLSHRELVIVGDAIVRIPRDDRGRHLPECRLATIEELVGAAAAPRRRHRTALLAALADIRVGSMSPLETDSRLVCAAAGLPEPRLDVEVRDAAGRLLGISDAAYVGFRVAVEVEGAHHRRSVAQWERDIEKYRAYAASGWEVVRLTAGHIRGAVPTAGSIVREVLLRRGWRP